MARQQQSELSRLETTGRTILFATSTIIKLSFYLVKFIFPSQRPKPSWPYKAAVGSTLTRWIFTYWTSIRLTTPRPLEGGKEASLFALATPGPSSLYAGPLSSSHTIRPGPLGNIWLPSRPSSSVPSTSTVFLHFHGGAYVVYSPRVSYMQNGPRRLRLVPTVPSRVQSRRHISCTAPGCRDSVQLPSAGPTRTTPAHSCLRRLGRRPSGALAAALSPAPPGVGPSATSCSASALALAGPHAGRCHHRA